MRAGTNRRSGGARGPGRLAALVAGFLILCGLALLVAGRPPERLSQVQEPARRSLTIRVIQLLETVQRAEEALHASDYGRSKGEIEQARRDLSSLLAEIQDVELKDPRGGTR